MTTCEVCGNAYDKPLIVIAAGSQHECPQIGGIKVIGHGLEAKDQFFCCAHCAEASGVTGLRDRV